MSTPSRRRVRRFALLAAAGAAIGLSLAGWMAVTQPVWGDEVGTVPVKSVSPDRLEAHVRALSERFVPRDFEHPANLDAAARYIHDELLAAGGEVSEQPYDVDGVTYRNVIAMFGPDTAARIVVGAHYDTAGPLPGADDNASGVAGLLELARILGADPVPMRVELVAYSLEEPPFFRSEQMGSAVHAADLEARGVEVRAMFSLEMLGYFSDEKGSQDFPFFLLKAFYPSRGNFIAVVGKLGQGGLIRNVKKAMRGASTLPVYAIAAPTFIPGIDFSDHLNYWARGWPAVMITDTAFMRNDRYHTELDTPDTLDYERMALVVTGVYAAVAKLAEK